MKFKISIGFLCLFVYLSAYYAAREAHWIIHTVSYVYASKKDGLEPIVVSHGVTSGDYTFFTGIIFLPVTWAEKMVWDFVMPPGSNYSALLDTNPQKFKSHEFTYRSSAEVLSQPKPSCDEEEVTIECAEWLYYRIQELDSSVDIDNQDFLSTRFPELNDTIKQGLYPVSDEIGTSDKIVTALHEVASPKLVGQYLKAFAKIDDTIVVFISGCGGPSHRTEYLFGNFYEVVVEQDEPLSQPTGEPLNYVKNDAGKWVFGKSIDFLCYLNSEITLQDGLEPILYTSRSSP